VPTVRRRISRPRVGVDDLTLTDGRAQHLIHGASFSELMGEGEPFESDDHAARVWAAHREALMAEAPRWPGRRPWGYWLELGVREWGDVGAVGEAHAVHILLKAKKISPVVPDEIQQIEARWRREIQVALSHYVRGHEAAAAERGVPRAFYRRHVRSTSLAGGG
jgi:hypothetical protein